MRKTKQEISKLSTSIPQWMKPLIVQRAAELDLTVSQYIRRLVNEEMGPNPLKVSAGKVVIADTTEY
jgi:hypothetical protein